MSGREALLKAAHEFETDIARNWGGGSMWLTSGTKVAGLVAEILRSMAEETGDE